ncbi:MAG TPA: hypothetical protein VHC23_00180 [Jatrophihabitans sp.]|nr:hypothetical protein [Jatrophihabitans sp.]
MFAAEKREETVRLLAEAHETPLSDEAASAQARTCQETLQLRIGRLQDAIEAGADPAALVDRLNAAHTELKMVEQELAAAQAEVQRNAVSEAQVRRLLASLDEVARDVFTEADPADLAEFYRSIGLTVSYDRGSRTAEASVTLAPSGAAAVGGVNGVRGGT